MSNWTLGTDLSHWAGDIDFGKMYAAGARWTVIKASDANRDTGFQFEDARFEQNAKQIFERGQLLAGCYHWLQASLDPIKAADFYLERYRKFNFHFPPVMDFEEKSVFGKGLANHYIWCAQTWLDYVHKQTGRLPIIYTANWYTSQFDQSKLAWMNKYPLWVASYPWVWTIFSKPVMPGKIWDDWTLWQYSADNNNRGKEFGRVGGSIDLNWFPGTYNELLAWLGVDAPAPPDEEDDVLFRARVVAGGLNVRSTPIYYADNRNKVGELKRGDEVDVYQVSADGWFRIGVNRWVNGHTLYMERLPDPVIPEPDPEPVPLGDLDWLMRIHTTDTDQHP